MGVGCMCDRGGPDIAPAARRKRPVPFDEVMDALRALDEEVRRSRRGPNGQRVAERWRKNPKSGTPDKGRGHAIS